MTDTAFFRVSSAACTHAGQVRPVNEDAWAAEPDAGLWAVADGMGGHAAGDYASRAVVEALRTVCKSSSLAGSICEVRGALERVNEQLRREAKRRAGALIGATVAVLLAHQRYCASLWAGDSRVYRCRNGRLEPLTRDHTQVEALVSAGTLRPEDAAAHPSANVVTRAVGGADELALEVEIQEIRSGDVYLVCSDGLTKELNEQEIAELLGERDVDRATHELVSAAVARGARDNVTVVVVRFGRPYPKE